MRWAIMWWAPHHAAVQHEQPLRCQPQQQQRHCHPWPTSLTMASARTLAMDTSCARSSSTRCRARRLFRSVSRSTCTADTAEHHAHGSPCWECFLQQASIPISLCDLMVVALPAVSCSHYRPASEGRLRMVSCSMHVPLTATMWCLGAIASPWGRICRGRWWRPEAGPG